MSNKPTLKYILKKAFNIFHINPAQDEIIKGIGEHNKYLVSGPKYELIDEVSIAQLASLGRQSIIISNSIDDMMDICHKLSEANIFATYIHGQLSDSEINQRLEAFRAKNVSLLFVTPDKAAKSDVLMSAIDVQFSVTIVILNSEKFPHDHLHYSTIYDELFCHIYAIEVELSKLRNCSFECNKLYIGYTLTKQQITEIIQRQRLHNAHYSILNYAFGHLVLESICVKNTSAMLRECAHICSSTQTKSIVVVSDKKAGESFYNELCKHKECISILANPSSQEAAEAIAKFKNLKSGILISNRYSNIVDSGAETVILAQLPLSASHLCSIMGAGNIHTGSIKNVYVLQREDVSFNHAVYELNCKFPTLESFELVIKALLESQTMELDKSFIFKTAKDYGLPAQTVFRVMDKLSSLSFLKKTVYFEHGFQAKYHILNLNRKLPSSINYVNSSVNSQLGDLNRILQLHACKVQALNSLIGTTNEVRCGKCSVCQNSTPGISRWKNRVSSGNVSDEQYKSQVKPISNQKSHQLYRNPYTSLSTQNNVEDYNDRPTNSLSRNRIPTVNLNLNDPIETQLCIIRKTVAKRLNIPEMSVFNDKTLKIISQSKPKSIHELNTINEFYGSQRSSVFGKEIIKIFNRK
ncbi:hypothetical protein GCM10011607_28770 [Shewanella inventionis]|uniref:HRDC domain-containing protein n=1 Tax=Shewanella inventionis TaxID=1738770 RepID=A0ABQ1JHD1_9GAMM|nr:HRDC domain-containing protein [Shewanella inventionis]GGB66362.1 hypothetical protein GCM10011607_28770 [Shewanella inventionis]